MYYLSFPPVLGFWTVLCDNGIVPRSLLAGLHHFMNRVDSLLSPAAEREIAKSLLKPCIISLFPPILGFWIVLCDNGIVPRSLLAGLHHFMNSLDSLLSPAAEREIAKSLLKPCIISLFPPILGFWTVLCDNGIVPRQGGGGGRIRHFSRITWTRCKFTRCG